MLALQHTQNWPILGPTQVRQLESALQTHSPVPLMQQAGLACARLALAMGPHARRVWIAAGPGNNGGDGLEAAMHLHRWGKSVVVSHLATPGPCPSQALAALHRAREAGVLVQSDVPTQWLAEMGPLDLCIDALLGIGANRPLNPDLRQWVQAINQCPAQVLAIDVPTGLNPQSGQWLDSDTNTPTAVQADQTLSLIAIQAGLLMGHGRDASGQIWLETLGHLPDPQQVPPLAWLNPAYTPQARQHASHKGLHGDVAVIGGEALEMRGMDMTGAAILAATAALHAGAGRVILSLLGGQASDKPPRM